LDILTEAFMHDPIATWLFPETDQRRRLQPNFYRPLLTHPSAATYLVSDGASIWLNLASGQATFDEAPPKPEGSLAFGESGERLQALGLALARRHPDREPHLYLACMGVVGDRQGAGLGTAMLRHGLEGADAAALGTYLEAGSPRSRALYLRHGFEDLGEPVQVDDSPPLWPMWRSPRRQKTQ
jgi:GNAT superfamily N-acetyltransferase